MYSSCPTKGQAAQGQTHPRTTERHCSRSNVLVVVLNKSIHEITRPSRYRSAKRLNTWTYVISTEATMVHDHSIFSLTRCSGYGANDGTIHLALFHQQTYHPPPGFPQWHEGLPLHAQADRQTEGTTADEALTS